jgi:hypothetical protein
MDAPTIDGEVDATYLREALTRAGHAATFDAIDVTPLTGGRMGAGVFRMQTSSGNSYVVKLMARNTWRGAGLNSPDGGEAPLWLAGATRTLEGRLTCPTIDVAHHAERDEWWMLMRDVSGGIVGRGGFGEAQSERLLDALAAMHARYWGRDDELAAMPLPDTAGTTQLFADAIVHVARPSESPAEWIPRFLADFQVMTVFAPIFLDVLPTADAEFYIELAANRGEWLPILERGPHTLVHGDLRRANIAYEGDCVALLDWEFAARAPAATDLQWHWFLQYWAYPPGDGVGPTERDHVRARYVDAVERELGRRIGREDFEQAWDVGWLRILVQLGYCLIDPLTSDDHTTDDIARVRSICSEAIDLARRIVDDRVR